jgi:hypothetical protein
VLVPCFSAIHWEKALFSRVAVTIAVYLCSAPLLAQCALPDLTVAGSQQAYFQCLSLYRQLPNIEENTAKPSPPRRPPTAAEMLRQAQEAQKQREIDAVLAEEISKALPENDGDIRKAMIAAYLASFKRFSAMGKFSVANGLFEKAIELEGPHSKP